MKSTVEKVSSLERRLKVEVPAPIVNSTFERYLQGVQKQANIKGFRQGKAPLSTVKSVYGERVKQDVIQELVQKHYLEALKEHSLDPINYPEFEFDAPSEGKDFSFSAHFEIRPDMELKKYEGLEVEKEKYEFDQARLDQILDNVRSSKATLVDVLEDRPAQKGDTAVIDFDGYVDGKPLEGGKGAGHQLELGANQFIEGFEDGVIGMKVGGHKVLNLKFPSPYHSAELAGKPVEFKVDLKGLKKKVLPELNDAFVADLMGPSMGETAKTLADFKKTISDDIEQTEKKRIEGDFKNRLLKAIVKNNPVEVPPSMLKEQVQALVEDTKRRMLEQGMSDAQFEEYASKWGNDYQKTAAEMIQSGFLVDAIAKKHGLRWNEQDLQAKYEEYAKQTGIDITRIKEFYSQPEQQNRVTYMITEEKVIDFLLKTAKVKEVAKDKLKD